MYFVAEKVTQLHISVPISLNANLSLLSENPFNKKLRIHKWPVKKRAKMPWTKTSKDILCTKYVMMIFNSLPQNAAEVMIQSGCFMHWNNLVYDTPWFSPFLSIHTLFVFFIKANHLGKSFHLNILKSSLKRRIVKCCEIYFEGYSNLYENLLMPMEVELRKESKF